MAASFTVAAPEFEPRQSDSNSVYLFLTAVQWWMCSGKPALSEVRKLGWVLALPFIGGPFKGEGTLSFFFCKMGTSRAIFCPIRVPYAHVLVS